jgi:hypothetical protein
MDFNCSAVRLELPDLEELEAAIRRGDLPHTTGFFFGSSTGSEKQTEKDLDFIKQARQNIEDGLAVFYTSWW